MASFGSLLTGVTALRASQQMLEVVGNNLANSSTPGYKAQGVRFADIFYDTLQPATPSTEAAGGSDPIQIGFGSKVASIDTVQSQGTLQPTGRDLDMGIQGDGYFQVSNGVDNFYTRAGGFDVDGTTGFLRDPSTGYNVMRFGSVGEGTATSPGFQTPGDDRIRIPFGVGSPGQVTGNVSLVGNLDSTAAGGATVPSAIQIYDSKGSSHTLTLTFTKTAADPTTTPPTPDSWTVTASVAASEGSVSGSLGPITFNSDGSPASMGNSTLTFDFSKSGASASQAVTFNMGSADGFTGLTEFGGNSTAAAIKQDGFSAGTLSSVSVSKDGTIDGVFSNGKITPLAQLAVAVFASPGGLSRVGNNLFSPTSRSGEALVGAGLAGGRGGVQQGVLEQSNVDVANEFTQLIVAQRSYEVNARTITVSDEVLQTLTGIIR